MSFANHGRRPENLGGREGSFFKEHIQKNNGCAPSAGCTGTVRRTVWEDEIIGKEFCLCSTYCFYIGFTLTWQRVLM